MVNLIFYHIILHQNQKFGNSIYCCWPKSYFPILQIYTPLGILSN